MSESPLTRDRLSTSLLSIAAGALAIAMLPTAVTGLVWSTLVFLGAASAAQSLVHLLEWLTTPMGSTVKWPSSKANEANEANEGMK